jgi:hypothetical protein
MAFFSWNKLIDWQGAIIADDSKGRASGGVPDIEIIVVALSVAKGSNPPITEIPREPKFEMTGMFMPVVQFTRIS